MLAKVSQIVLLAMTCAFALLAVELPNMLYAVIALLGMSVALGGLFWLLRAPYVAVFQLLLYAGAVVALFVIIVMLTSRKKRKRANPRARIGVAGIFTSLLVTSLMSIVIWNYAFPLFRHAEYEVEFVRALVSTVGQKVSRFLWANRALELIAQALLLLTAAIACISLLRPGGEGGAKE